MAEGICVFSLSNLLQDARVRKHVVELKKQFEDITTVSLAEHDMDGVDNIVVPRPEKSTFMGKVLSVLEMLLGLHEKYCWKKIYKMSRLLENQSFDLYLVNDLITLPLIVRLAQKNKARIIFDAHEYFPLVRANRWYWNYTLGKFHVYLCENYLRHTDYRFTVCQTIAREYEKEFGFEFHVLRNVPYYRRAEFRPVKDGEKIRIIHHGVTISDRKPEMMIEMMKFLDDRYQLHFMFVNNEPGYLRKLIKLSRKIAGERIFFEEPVSPDAITEKISKYDIGLFVIPPVNFSYEYTLPNKLFDFIMAGLCVAIAPSPEMRNVVERYGCGVVSKDFTAKSMADILNKLTVGEINSHKLASLKAAKELFAEEEWNKLRDAAKSVLGRC